MANLKNVNLMSQDTFESIEQADDELYAVSASGIGFPSSRYEDLTLGASGTEYTAPANGRFFIYKNAGGTNQYVTLTNTSCANMQTHFWVPISGAGCANYIEARKGDVVKITYTASGATNYFRFIYAEGE